MKRWLIGLCLLAPSLSAQTLPPIPPRQPVNQSQGLFDELLDQLIWQDLFENLFRAPFNANQFWHYRLDRLPTKPDDYSGWNQFGQIYIEHVHQLTDLGFQGPFHLQQADVGLETSYALIETQGLMIDDGQQATYLPVHYADHYPSDYGIGRDCVPPTVDPNDCDPFDCGKGAVKYLDQACVTIAGKRFKDSCKASWGVYDAQMEAAEARWNNCTNLAFVVAAGCYTTSVLSGIITLGLGPPLGAVACTGILAAQLDFCDSEYRTAGDLARKLRDIALNAILDAFNTDALLCCKDCPPIDKKEQPPKRQP